jgi:hypothetical protein
MRRIRRPRKLTLSRALKIGYLRNEQKQAKRLKKFGYRIDRDLTNNNVLTAFNPFNNKVITVVNGTNPLSPADLWTDLRLASGNLKGSDRYKDAESIYLKAKKKYEAPVTIVGHSLGGAIATNMVLPSDRAIVYGAANSPFTKKKENLYSYRTSGDPFSAFDATARTMNNPETNPLKLLNPIQPHNVSNIVDKPIFV